MLACPFMKRENSLFVKDLCVCGHAIYEDTCVGHKRVLDPLELE